MEDKITDQYTKEDLDFMQKFLYKEFFDHVLIKNYLGNSDEVIIPNSFRNKPITFIDKNFFDTPNFNRVTRLVLNDNLISCYSQVKNAPSITSLKLGERVNCVESLIKDSNIQELELGKNQSYKFIDGCLLSKNGENLIWNLPWIKKVPRGVINIGAASQFYDSIVIPDSVSSIHVESFKSKIMLVYYCGRKTQWVNIRVIKSLTSKDIRKGRFDNELKGNTIEKKFRKGKNKLILIVKYNIKFK